MKQQTAPAMRRGRALADADFPPEFVRNAYTLAIWRAARDAHRAACDRDAVDCDACRKFAQGIAEAKYALNHGVNLR